MNYQYFTCILQRFDVSKGLFYSYGDGMDIRFLETFLKVSETRHFGKAAENLYLTQSAVSARIKQLEEYFNSALFVRNRNSLQLTSAGEKLLPFAKELTENLKKTRHAMNEESIEYLSIACTPNAWDIYLKQNLDVVNRKVSNISIRAEICSHEQLSRMVHEHTADLAMTTIPFKTDDVETIELSDSILSLYCSPELDKSPLQHLSIAIDWGKKTSELLEKEFPQMKRSTIRTSSLQVALNYLNTNQSAIILPEQIAKPMVSKKKLIKVKSLAPLSVKCYLIYLKETKNAWLGEFINMFKQGVKTK